MTNEKRTAAHGLLAARLKTAKRLKVQQQTVEYSKYEHLENYDRLLFNSNAANDADSGDEEDTQQVTASCDKKII
jgi:hypothetical protein